jgi:2-polyprenyl-6-hydroxyphenyl methylase/3-demethylubiquinone-9 3-methyltransferase
VTTTGPRARNDPGQYDDLVDEWWDPRGQFAMLQWIAAARAGLVPPARRAGALLVDAGCGAGLLAPHLTGLGYTHVGVDLTRSALALAQAHGVTVARGDISALPIPDGAADVVCAGEILEHVPDVPVAMAELCRALRPGGTLVIDTLADTALARLLVVTLAERIPRGAPPGLHDPSLFVNRRALVAEAARHGVTLTLHGLRPSLPATASWLVKRRAAAVMVPTWSTAVLYQGHGTKEAR